MANQSKFVRNADGSVSFEINDEKILQSTQKKISGGATDVKASDIDSESATEGQLLTADGLGGASWMNNIIPKPNTTSTQYSLLVGNNGTYSEILGRNNLTQIQPLVGEYQFDTYVGMSMTRDSVMGPKDFKFQMRNAGIILGTSNNRPQIILRNGYFNTPPQTYTFIEYMKKASYGALTNVDGLLIRIQDAQYSGDMVYTPSLPTEAGYYFPKPSQTTNILTVATVPTSETFTITTWTADNSIAPFTHKTTITATTTIASDTVVELVNNNAISFATYGFSIGDVTNQVVTIYSIGQPNSNINFLIRVGN